MSMTETKRLKDTWNRWAVPAICFVIGAAYLVAGLVGDNRSFAIAGPLIMLAAAVIFLVLTRFSETARGMRDRRDERINSIDRDATVAAGVAVIIAVIAGFVIDVARGGNGQPYGLLGAIGGVTYLLALVWYRLRR